MSCLSRAAGLALAFVLAGPVHAQHTASLQRFRLNHAIAEPAITACLSQDVPIRVNTLLSQGQETEAGKAFEQAVSDGKCVNGAGVVTYTKQVHRVDADDGTVWTVYQGSAGRATFYVPMHGFLHEDMTI